MFYHVRHTLLYQLSLQQKKIRSEISKICNPTWVYVHRTLPKREGHIYEEPSNIFTVNSDELRPRQSAMSVLAYLQTNGFFVK